MVVIKLYLILFTKNKLLKNDSKIFIFTTNIYSININN